MPETVPTYLAAQVRAAEAPLLAAGEPLMMRAAAALADVVREELADAFDPRVLVVAGSGDNGGDALFAAASLALDASVDVLLVSTRFHEEALAAAAAAGVRRVELPEARESASGYDVLIDGIVGIGATSGLRGSARSAVEALLTAVRLGRPRVVAVDVPSGLHPDTGEADDAVLPAAFTVTMGGVKAGLVSGRGPDLCGRVVLVDIGLGEGLASVEAVGEASVDGVVRG